VTAEIFNLEQTEEDTTESLKLTVRAEMVIDFFNEKAGKKCPSRNPKGKPTVNMQLIICRFNEGYTVQDCKSVIARQIREWENDDNMHKFIQIKTIFRRCNFETYYGECG
tara:strand:- start:12 stop:341 length:330 start_codon:yes stop_codon:yes gene_type:complete